MVTLLEKGGDLIPKGLAGGERSWLEHMSRIFSVDFDNNKDPFALLPPSCPAARHLRVGFSPPQEGVFVPPGAVSCRLRLSPKWQQVTSVCSGRA